MSKPRFYVVKAKDVQQGDRITGCQPSEVLQRRKRTPNIFYVARNEEVTDLGYNILWLLDPSALGAPAIRYTRYPNVKVLVERPF